MNQFFDDDSTLLHNVNPSTCNTQFSQVLYPIYVMTYIYSRDNGPEDSYVFSTYLKK